MVCPFLGWAELGVLRKEDDAHSFLLAPRSPPRLVMTGSSLLPILSPSVVPICSIRLRLVSLPTLHGSIWPVTSPGPARGWWAGVAAGCGCRQPSLPAGDSHPCMGLPHPMAQKWQNLPGQHFWGSWRGRREKRGAAGAALCETSRGARYAEAGEGNSPPCLPSIAAQHQRGSTTCVHPALPQSICPPGNG